MLKSEFKRPKTIYADGGYRVDLMDVAKGVKYTLKIALRKDKSKRFKLLSKR